MNCSRDDLCRERIAFQGRIVADASHEIQNHFAVIKEYSGLIGDLLRARTDNISGTVNRCAGITTNINERANQAAEMVDALNRFAHRGDSRDGSFRADEAVEELVLLMQRFAAQKRIAITASHGRKTSELPNDPSLLQYLVHTLVASLVGMMEESGNISVATSRGKNGTVEVEISTRNKLPAFNEHDLMAPEILNTVLSRLSASLSIESERRSGKKILLTFSSLAAP